MSLVQLGIAAGNAISQKNIGYPPFGVFSSNQSNGVSNSNAVISTLFKAMGLEEPFPDKPAPGRGTLLLSTDEINAIRTGAGFQKINFDGGLWLQQDANGFLWTSIGTEDSEPLIRISKDGTGVISDSRGTIANLTASDILEVGEQPDGSPGVILVPDASGVSRSIVVDEKTGSASVQVAGETLLTASIGSQISVTGRSVTVQQTQDGWTTTTTASDGSVSVLLSKPNDGISFGLGQDTLTGKLQIASADVAGQTFSGGSFQDWLAATLGTVNDGQTSSGLSSASIQLTADFSNIANGITTGLDTDTASLVALSVLMDNNVHSANYLGQRIGYGNVSDRWVQSFIGAPPNSTVSSVLLTAAGAYNPGVAFAQSQILSFAMQPPPPSVYIVQVIGYGDLGNFIPPLVLDLDGHGIDLVAQNKSTAHFDVHNDGSRPQVSWVGASNGFLVFDRNHNGLVDNASEWFGDSFTKDGSAPQPGLNGFSALATLATSGAASFSKATSLIDSATGKSYFDEVQLWVDANQDGITDAGELHSLADFGINSINLSAQSVGKIVNGNLVMSSGAYTLSDGTQRTIDDIGLSTQTPTTTSSSGLSAATLAFAELVAKGMPALAAGQAQAVSAKMVSLPVSFSAEFAAIQQWSGSRLIIIDGYPLFNEHVGDPTQVNFLSWPSGYPRVGHTVPIPAPQSVEAALSAITAAASAVKSGADALSGGATALSAAQLSALTEDLDPTSAHAADANKRAAQASVALGNAVSSVVNANTAIVNAGNLIATATNLLAQIVPVNYETSGNVANGSSYASPGDAFLASASFAGLESGLKAFASVKDAEKQVLSAFAQAGNYGAVLIGGGGTTQTAGSQRTLFLAGSGNQTLVGGSEHDDFAFTTVSGTATVQSFLAGPTGDTLEFLNVGSSVTVGDDGHGGSTVAYGSGQSVDITGVLPSQLNLYTNIVGIDTVSFASAQSAGTRTLGGSQPVFYDGQQHVRSLTASNYGDVLIGNSVGNTLIGGLGNDTLEGYGGADTLDGKSGVNAVSYAWSSTGITANLLVGTDSTGSTLFNLQNITGSGQGDVLTGDGNNNILDGNGGSDTLVGGGGNDTYVFKIGYGQLKINNGVVANGVPSGTLALGVGISPDNLWFSRSGSDLVVQRLGSSDRITVQGWFSDAYRELLSIKLAGGLQIGTQAVNNLVTALAAYQSTNPTFSPSLASQLPQGMSLTSYFTTNTIPGSVPTAPNVKLITQQADQAGLAAAAATQVSQLKTSFDGQLAAASDANNSVVNWSMQGKALPAGVASYTYAATPYTRVMTIPHYDLYGGYTIPAGGQQIYALTPSTLYFLQTIKPNDPQFQTLTYLLVISTDAISNAIGAMNQVYSLLAPVSSLEQALAAAGGKRQSALHAAVVANGASADASLANAARTAASAAEASLGSAISRYYSTVLVNLPAAAATLQNNQALLSGVVPQTTTVPRVSVTTYKPYSSTDQSQLDAMAGAQSAAAAALSSANAAVGSFISAYASLEGFSSAQLAGNGANLTARANGDFLIAAGPGDHIFAAGSGADLFAVGNWNDSSGIHIQSFQTGVSGDRLLVVPTSDRTVYLNEDADHNAYVFFKTTGGMDAVKLDGTTLNAISLYDNIIGVDNASYQNSALRVTVSLASVTPRDYDGSSHIRNLTGSDYDDVLSGDQQDNSIFGGAGNDTIAGGAGNDTLDGGSGINTVSFADNPNGVTVDLWQGTAQTGYGGSDVLSHFQNVIGSDHGDKLYGDTGDNVLTGGAGDDLLDGGVGNDTLIGGGGDDTYEYNYNKLTIVNGVSSNSGATGRLQLGSALQPSSLWFSRSGNDLVIDMLGQSNGITVKGWFANAYSQLEYLVLPDGSKITASAVTGLATAMTNYAAAHPTYNPQSSNVMPVDAALADALNTYWARTLTAVGGSVSPVYYGNKTVVGGAGTDTAIFQGNAADYLVRTDAAGVTTVIDTVIGRDGTNTLKGIELLKFADRTDAPPVAHDDALATSLNYGAAWTPDQVLNNDADADAGDVKTIVSVSATSALGAAVSLQYGYLIYDPRGAAALHGIGAGQTKTDTFTYTMKDAAGATSTATVTMTVYGADGPATPAGLFRVGSEFLVNTNTASDQTAPSITGLSDGSFLVTWTDRSSTLGDASGTSVKGQIFSALGDKLGVEFLVNVQTAGSQDNPSISALAGGGFVAAWESNGIKVRAFDAAGREIVSELRVDQIADGNSQVKPSVTGLRNGNFVVTWQDGFYDGDSYINGSTAGSFLIQGQMYDRTGHAIGGRFQVNTAGQHEEAPAITSLAAGGFVVTWQDDDSLNEKVQVFDQNGQKKGAEVAITSGVTGAPPAITSLANGGFAVTWLDASSNINVQVFDDAGNKKTGSPLQVAALSGFAQYTANPTIALSNGGFVVTWIDTGSVYGDSSGSAIMAQAFDADGRKAGGEFLVNSQTAGYQLHPAIAGLSNGGFAVAWQDGGTEDTDRGGSGTLGDGSGTSIKAQVFGMSTGNIIRGTEANDILTNVGSATLIGNGGTDTYRLDQSQSSSTIINGSAAGTSPSGTVQFTGVNPAQLWFDHAGLDLTISVLGTNQRATVQSWYGASGAQLESVQAGDFTLQHSQIDALIQAMAAFESGYAATHGGMAFNPASNGPTIVDATVLTAVSNAWHQAA